MTNGREERAYSSSVDGYVRVVTDAVRRSLL